MKIQLEFLSNKLKVCMAWEKLTLSLQLRGGTTAIVSNLAVGQVLPAQMTPLFSSVPAPQPRLLLRREGGSCRRCASEA